MSICDCTLTSQIFSGLDFALLQKMREEIVKTDLAETTKQEAMETLKVQPPPSQLDRHLTIHNS